MKIIKSLRTPLLISAAMFVICGLLYPLATTLFAGVLFPKQAGGSLEKIDGNVVGTSLVGQDFTDSRFMKCRPSAVNYNTYTQEEKSSGEYAGLASGSDNFSPSNPELIARVAQDYAALIKANMQPQDIPGTLLETTIPAIAPYMALQDALDKIPDIAQSTGLAPGEIEDIIKAEASDSINSISAAELIGMKLKNAGISKDKEKQVYEALEKSSGKILLAPKVNLEILKKMDKAGVDLGRIPADLLTSSGSGLDPHISPASARIQIPALAVSTGLSEQQLTQIVQNNTKGKLLGIFGEETVNVLQVNMEIAKQLNLV